jgi:hypothetical protein
MQYNLNSVFDNYSKTSVDAITEHEPIPVRDVVAINEISQLILVVSISCTQVGGASSVWQMSKIERNTELYVNKYIHYYAF